MGSHITAVGLIVDNRFFEVIRGTILHWIKHFLENTSQKVVVGNAMSSPSPVASGVPQGSVIGPAYSLCIVNNQLNDLTDCILSETTLFADDTI